MIDWMQDHPAATWLGLAVVLAVVEVFSLDLVLLMFALGAVGGSIAAGFGAPLWLAILIFAVVSVAFLSFVRPPIVHRLHAGPTLTTGHAALVGRSAVVLEPVDKRNGRIQLAGEVWSARTADEHDMFETGTEVLVTRIDGATAVVTTKES
jgi:membrane protein implicated in regulation of membrane protease activity